MRSGNREPCPATSEQRLLLLYNLVVVGFGAQNGTVGLGVVRTAYARARAAHSEIKQAREFTTAVLFALYSHCKPNVVSDITSLQRVVKQPVSAHRVRVHRYGAAFVGGRNAITDEHAIH